MSRSSGLPAAASTSATASGNVSVTARRPAGSIGTMTARGGSLPTWTSASTFATPKSSAAWNVTGTTSVGGTVSSAGGEVIATDGFWSGWTVTGRGGSSAFVRFAPLTLNSLTSRTRYSPPWVRVNWAWYRPSPAAFSGRSIGSVV